MAVEIERKFLVRDDRWRERVVGSLLLRQGYLANTRASSIRLRIGAEIAGRRTSRDET